MKKIKPGFTRQGVRDLSTLKGPSIGRKLPMPPDQAMVCPHTFVSEVGNYGDSKCRGCGQMWDFDGKAYN
jgi:hypothetical protein